jgi:hypothetical protein
MNEAEVELGDGVCLDCYLEKERGVRVARSMAKRRGNTEENRNRRALREGLERLNQLRREEEAYWAKVEKRIRFEDQKRMARLSKLDM